MARFNANEVDNYGGQGGAGYFSLKNDKDVARVRFLYDGIEDVEGFAVHQVEVDGKKRWVNCLRDYRDPVDACPMCRERMFQSAKFYIPIYNIDEDKVQIWERGKKFISKISSLCARYPHLCSHVFEIERNGKAGDTNTTYEIYEVDRDDTTLEDLPEVPEVLGGLVLDKTAEEMEYYLANGVFPQSGNSEEVPFNESRTESRNSYPTSGRRTPASSRGRDRF